MWLTSISIPEETERRQSFSRNKAKGSVILQSLLLPDSAPELSLKLFKQIGTRCAGKNLAAVNKMAIWANVSNAEMERCMSSES